MEVKRFENLPNDFSNLKNLNQTSTVYLSSARKSNGINELLDNNLSLFWQSNKKADCTENHFILYEFEKLESIKYICINLNYDVDESYTPKQVVVKCGLYIEDLKVNINQKIDEFFLERPNGWFVFSFKYGTVNCLFLKIEIGELHDSGKDCHVRMVKILGGDDSNSESEAKFSNKFLIR